RDTLVRQGLLHLLGNQAQVAALVPLIDESAGLQPVKDAQVFLHIVLLLRLQSRVGCCGRLPVDEYRVPGDGHLRTGAHHRGDAVISHPGAVGGADHHRRLVAAGNGDARRGTPRSRHAGHVSDITAQGEPAGRPVHVHLSAQ
ncbi:Head decoration protein, partial [Dysosmobacter welbionis]